MAAEMKSMELDDDDKLNVVSLFPMVEPDFPCNLRIALTEKEFKKLECDPTVAEKGAIVEGRFEGRIKSVHFMEKEDACRVEIQIEKLGLECESEAEENEEQEKEED